MEIKGLKSSRNWEWKKKAIGCVFGDLSIVCVFGDLSIVCVFGDLYVRLTVFSI